MRSPYRQNAFFLLDARADATVQEIRRLQNRAEVLLEMHKSLQSSVFPFLRRNQVTREDVLSGTQRLEDGQSRIREELYWVHAGPRGDCLPTGSPSLSSLIGFLNKASQGTGRQAAIAVHNLAIANHALAFEQEFSKNATLQARQEAWSAALSAWHSAFKSEEFWDFMSERVSSWGDPTVSDSDLQKARRELSEELLRPQRQLAADYVASGNYDFARLHIQLIQVAGNRMPVAKRYLSEISTEIVRQVRDVLDGVLLEVSEEALTPLQNEQKKERLTSAEKEIIKVGNKAIASLSLFQEMQESSDALGDQIGQCLRSVSIRYFNQLDDSQNSLRLLSSALGYARSPSCKAQISRDQGTIEYRSLCDLSRKAANQGQYKTAQEYLEQAKNLAPETESAQIEEWLATCKRNRVLEGVDTKHNSPSLGRINGIGTAFFGERDHDAATNSYVTTHFFTFFFWPVIPLAAYRVASAGGRSYRIFGKVPLSKMAIWYRRVVLAAVALFVLYSMIQSNGAPSSSSTPSMPSGYTSPNSTPVTSPPLSSYQTDASGKDELDRTRQALDLRESSLRQEKQDLDALQGQLQSLKRDIGDLKTEYPDGGMPSYAHTDYEDKLERYNGLVPVYNQKLTTFQDQARDYEQDVANFNARVREYNGRQ
jgi:tetratricopeptide (TPR) repeat protein